MHRPTWQQLVLAAGIIADSIGSAVIFREFLNSGHDVVQVTIAAILIGAIGLALAVAIIVRPSNRVLMLARGVAVMTACVCLFLWVLNSIGSGSSPESREMQGVIYVGLALQALLLWLANRLDGKSIPHGLADASMGFGVYLGVIWVTVLLVYVGAFLVEWISANIWALRSGRR